VESGLRSGDRSMPEEVNRVLTDHLAELLFTTEPDGNRNLAREGIPPDKIHFVGNSMIDSLAAHLLRAVEQRPWERLDLTPDAYGVVTLHRPSNVDDPKTARELAAGLAQVATDLPLVFPVHPRTLNACGDIWCSVDGLRLLEPLGYVDFIGLMARAQVVITDSGGIQEETTFLQVPCVTVRWNTERPVTITEGTNTLVAPRAADMVAAVCASRHRRGAIPELWDGRAGGRIVDVIEAWLAKS
ncbi:MAG: UDP-N-acetyl glucosamine 2-epimerase, partial [Actinobacteria bacterium]|nr:UDP-N-acetyl glucosamine 2-epimerase [Actinomycetota bacterium]